MSKYRQQPIEFSGLHTIPIEARGGKVQVRHFAKAFTKGAGMQGWLDSLPDILAAGSLRAVLQALLNAKPPFLLDEI